MRPTFAINCLVPLIISFAHERKVMLFAFAFLFFLAASLGIDFILPRLFMLTCWNFCKFKAIDDLSSFYGTNGFTWYFWSALADKPLDTHSGSKYCTHIYGVLRYSILRRFLILGDI